MEIANVGVVELAEIDLGPLRSIVPPDRVSISLDQLEEPLDDGFLDRVAGRTAVGIGPEGDGAAIEKIQQRGWNIFEPFIAQRPNRGPLDLGRWIEPNRRDLRLAGFV